MEIRIGKETYKAEFNGFTPVIYSRVFSEESKGGYRKPGEITNAVAQIAESIAAYDIPAITPLLKILYACIKTADAKYPKSFKEFAASLPVGAYNLQCEEGWATDVMGIVEANFFPQKTDGVDAAPAEKAVAEASK